VIENNVNILTSMNALFTYLAAWWLYGAVGTYVLGTQSGGRPLVWGLPPLSTCYGGSTYGLRKANKFRALGRL